MKQFSKGDPRQWAPEPYVPFFQAMLGVEKDAAILALRGENGDAYKPTGADAFSFEMSDDIGEFLEKEWLVENWLGSNETSLFVGEPGSGKSCLVASLGVHIAAGLPWFGLKTSTGGVVYFAGERVELTRRRIAGLQRYHSVPKGQPLAIASGPLDLGKPESVRGFVERINQFEDQTDQTPMLVIIDTFSRVFSGQDENDASAMSAAYAHVDQIRKESGAHVILVHHSGVSIDSKRRGRGSSVQTGAIDTSVVITKNSGGGCAEVVKSNDSEEGLKITWSLESFPIATNAETGKITSVPIPVPQPLGNLGGRFVAMPLAKLTVNQGVAFGALRKAIETDGTLPPNGTPGFPADIKTVSREQFREAFYLADTVQDPEALADSRRRRFNRGISELENLGRIAVLGERFWLVK